MCSPDVVNGCCPPNTQTVNPNAAPAELKNGKPYLPPVQVVRAQPDTDPVVEQVNQAFQQLLAGSVWANYKLINTQWPTKPNDANAQPAPAVLANTTMETFNQGPTPPADANPPYPYPVGNFGPFSASVSSSCLKCHSTATAAVPPASDPNGSLLSDFSFLMGNAVQATTSKTKGLLKK